MWTADFISRVTGARLAAGDAHQAFSGVSTDSRRVRPGELFIALTGERYNGNNFVAHAREQGAAGFLVSQNIADIKIYGQGTVLVTQDTRQALWDFARAHRLRFNIPVVAVTGTCGKSSTKDLISAALGDPLTVAWSPASYNNHIGVPLSLLRIRTRHRYAVLELGSNHPGEIEALTQLVQPHIAVITHVGTGHTQGLKDRWGILDEKLSIVKGLPKGGVLILDGDDDLLVQEARARGFTPVLCGWGAQCRFRPDRLRMTPLGTQFDVLADRFFARSIGQDIPALRQLDVSRNRIRTRLFGDHNVRNVMLAFAVAKLLRIPHTVSLAGLGSVDPLNGRLSPHLRSGGVILDDSYNANPSSVRTALNTLRDWPSTSRRVVILGDMLELGSQSERWHRRIGEMVALINPELLVTCGDQARFIQEGCQDVNWTRLGNLHFRSAASCAAQIKDVVRKGDVILVKGSRQMHMDMIVKRLTEPAVPHAIPSPVPIT